MNVKQLLIQSVILSEEDYLRQVTEKLESTDHRVVSTDKVSSHFNIIEDEIEYDKIVRNIVYSKQYYYKSHEIHQILDTLSIRLRHLLSFSNKQLDYNKYVTPVLKAIMDLVEHNQLVCSCRVY
jgi:hypothetical protein